MLADAHDGKVLAVVDSIEITILRTAAATAVAAKKLARTDARTLLVIGCGHQARSQVRALRRVRNFEAIYAMNADPRAAKVLADEMGARVVEQPVDADVVITCTPSKSAILHTTARGTFVAAVGADSSEKHEIAVSLMSASKVVTDVTAQCETIGDLHHALAAGAMSRDQVHAELGGDRRRHQAGSRKR